MRKRPVLEADFKKHLLKQHFFVIICLTVFALKSRIFNRWWRNFTQWSTMAMVNFHYKATTFQKCQEKIFFSSWSYSNKRNVLNHNWESFGSGNFFGLGKFLGLRKFFGLGKFFGLRKTFGLGKFLGWEIFWVGKLFWVGKFFGLGNFFACNLSIGRSSFPILVIKPSDDSFYEKHTSIHHTYII